MIFHNLSINQTGDNSSFSTFFFPKDIFDLRTIARICYESRFNDVYFFETGPNYIRTYPCKKRVSFKSNEDTEHFFLEKGTSVCICLQGDTIRPTPEEFANQLFELFNPYDIDIKKNVRFIDKKSLKKLIETSTGKVLKPDYFETERFLKFLIAGDYLAGAVIEPVLLNPNGSKDTFWEYIDKFVVAPENQGNGIGSFMLDCAVIDAMQQPLCNGVVWRGDPAKPAKEWYENRIHNLSWYSPFRGYVERDGWAVFYVGKTTQGLEEAIEYSANKGKTLFKPGEAII